MANMSIIRELCNQKKITLSELAEKSGVSYQGIQRMLRTNVSKTETLEKIADTFGVHPKIFFYDDSEIKQDRYIQLISGVDRDFLKILSNRYDSYLDKVGFYKDYYIWKIISFIKTLDVVTRTILPVFPILYKKGPRFLTTGEQAYQIQMIIPETELPFSKWGEGYQGVVKVTNIVQSFYFLMFMDNMLNISDLMSDNLLDDAEIKKYWKIWLQSEDRHWLSFVDP